MTSFTEALNNSLPQVAFNARVGQRNLIGNEKTSSLLVDGDIILFMVKVLNTFKNKKNGQKYRFRLKNEPNCSVTIK